MDLSVLPNNNHPDKFLQLDVKSLMRSSTLLQASLARFPGGNYPATQHWQNLVYSQVRSKGLKIKGGGMFLSHYMTFSHSCEEGGLGGGGYRKAAYFTLPPSLPVNSAFDVQILLWVHSPPLAGFSACFCFRFV